MPGLLEFFLWLDGSATRYWTVAWSMFGLWLLAAVLPHEAGHRWRRWNSPAVYAGLMLLMLVAFRWPGIGRNFQLDNPDESQMLAGALTCSHYEHYWGVVDCGSAGMLDIMPLVLPRLLGLPLDYTTARSVGLLLLWGACVFGWFSVRHVSGDRASRIVMMPMACCIAFTHYADFVQYSTEQAPIFFCAMAVWLALGSFSATGRVTSRTRLALAGATLGLLPFAKLQAAPFGLCTGLCTLIWIAGQKESPWRCRLIDAGCLAAGALLSSGLVGLTILHRGASTEFYHMFWLNSLNYAQAREYPWSAFGDTLVHLTDLVSGFLYYLFPAFLLMTVGLAGWTKLPRALWRFVLFGLFFFFTGFFVIAAPGRAFQHYLQFLIFPTSLCVGFLYAGLATGGVIRRNVWLGLVLLLGVGPQVYYRTHDWNPFQGDLPMGRITAVGAVARHILAHTQPGDTLVVWAWMPTFYVQTQLPQGTSDACSSELLNAGPLQDYFRARYFNELKKHPPAVFVDAVGEMNFGYHNRQADSHESIPWLEEFIRTNYVLSADIETSRIYVRKDRWTASAH